MSVTTVAAALAAGQRFVVTTHLQPDGDGIGAALALRLALLAAGKSVRVVCPSPVASTYRFLPGFDAIEVLEEEAQAKRRKLVDAVVSLDCGDLERLGAVAKWPCGQLVNIDHHAAGRPFGDAILVDGQAACTAQLVARVLRQLRWPVTSEIATCLYTGLVFDTGRFMHDNTSAREFRFAAQLVAAGVDAAQVNRQLAYQRSQHDLAIEALGIKRLRVDEDDPRLAGIALSKADIARVGAPEDWGDLVDIPRSLRGVEIAYLAREQDDGAVRLSLRANPPYAVAPVAVAFGGGGHLLAAGCTVQGGLRATLRCVLPLLREQLG